MDQKFRKQHIEDLISRLDHHMSETYIEHKKHKAKIMNLDKVFYVMCGGTILIGSITPLATIPLGIICAVFGGMTAIIKSIKKKYSLRLDKLEAIINLISKTEMQFDNTYSSILSDQTISDTEFQKMTNLFQQYQEELTILRNTFEQKISRLVDLPPLSMKRVCENPAL